ncbi:hypothetical protein ABTN28_19455, partial [Acinetobacter baumannii]
LRHQYADDTRRRWRQFRAGDGAAAGGSGSAQLRTAGRGGDLDDRGRVSGGHAGRALRPMALGGGGGDAGDGTGPAQGAILAHAG